ncbi:hypothetical protein OsccyDRAFT_4712 [Leptolyngbyaceae cyanobacterium JSC-12]|nr:hypothetical protein OsccyDRAFT_4712 [Leptolyngbyaceae cyanobacterium JSC-12]
MKRLNVAFALLPLILVTSCLTRTVREKHDQACSNLADLNTAIAVIRRINDASASTANALKQAEEQVTEAFRNLKMAIGDLEESQIIDDLETAYKDLDKAVKDIPDQSTLSSVKAIIADKITKLESASLQMKSKLRCPSLESAVTTTSIQMGIHIRQHAAK